VAVKEYCAALQSMQPARVRKIFPLVPDSILRDFKQYKELKCSVGEPLEYVRLDPGTSGGAAVKFPMKQVVLMQSGGAQKVYQLIVDMNLSRKDDDSPWLIDKVEATLKPPEK